MLPLLVSFFFIISLSPILADDWPQFRGPERNGISKETNLLKIWPEQGPVLLWSYEELGSEQHWTHPAISDGRLYLRHGEALMVYDIKK
jgi:hypothetical protein